ncbi:MAG: hypothetical protein IME93_00125 [Proteobacteria bacterium]|nr:hypothetical protein [Pseudomonadota bacterium]
MSIFSVPAQSLAETDIWGDEIDLDPTLAEIHYISLREQKQKTVPVLFKTGQQLSTEAGKGFDRITIKPGSDVISTQRPGEVRLNLYRGGGKQRVLIGSLSIRYYRQDDDNWTPRYMLVQEPIVIRQGNRLIPLASTTGAGNLVLVGNNLPNAEGYYSELTFTQGLDKTFVDTWQIFRVR